MRPVSGIEDVGVVRRALFDGPILHRRGDDVGDRRVELLARLDRLAERLEDRLRQAGSSSPTC